MLAACGSVSHTVSHNRRLGPTVDALSNLSADDVSDIQMVCPARVQLLGANRVSLVTAA